MIENQHSVSENAQHIATIEDSYALTPYIEQLASCAATDDVRPVLNNVLFDKQYIVAVDGYRLARVTMDMRVDAPFMVNAKAFQAAWNSVAARRKPSKNNPATSVNMVLDDDALYLQSENAMASVALVTEGRFPDWRAVIPRNHDAMATLDAKTRKASKRTLAKPGLAAALRAMPMTEEGFALCLNTDGTVRIYSKSLEHDDADFTLDAAVVTASSCVTLGYSREVAKLANMRGDKPLHIALWGDFKPVTFEIGSLLILQMPIFTY